MHDATRRDPAHRLEAYSSKCLERNCLKTFHELQTTVSCSEVGL
jgi:hypothetical protein